MRLPLTGGCQCGAVRYEIRAQPLTVYACHCTECQRQSASAFSLSLVVARDAVVIIAGTPKQWRRVIEGTRAIGCVFCGECGVRLLHNPERNPQVSIVKPGTARRHRLARAGRPRLDPQRAVLVRDPGRRRELRRPAARSIPPDRGLARAAGGEVIGRSRPG
jgi:hypothetical protein